MRLRVRRVGMRLRVVRGEDGEVTNPITSRTAMDCPSTFISFGLS